MSVFIVFFMGGCITLNGVNKGDVQKKMTEYLKNTYEKEFVVEEPRLLGNEGFGYRVYEARAYPKDDPEMRFRVRWEKGEPGIFDDGYIHAIWRNGAMAEFHKLLKDIYGEGVVSLYGFNFNFKHYEIDFNDVKDLSYSDLIKRYPDKIFCDMKYYVFVDGSIDKRQEAEKVYRLIKQHILDRNIGKFHLVVNYMSDDFREDFDKNFKSIRLGRNGYDADSLYKQRKLVNRMGLVDIDLKEDYINDIINEFDY